MRLSPTLSLSCKYSISPREVEVSVRSIMKKKRKHVEKPAREQKQISYYCLSLRPPQLPERGAVATSTLLEEEVKHKPTNPRKERRN